MEYGSQDMNIDLDTKHQNRVISIKEWRKYVNVVQQLDEDFKDFIEQNKKYTQVTS